MVPAAPLLTPAPQCLAFCSVLGYLKLPPTPAAPREKEKRKGVMLLDSLGVLIPQHPS